jgi:SNF2 family DNA or RNA helicase
VAIDTVEERILELQQHKRELAARALEGSGRAAALTRDDLMDLLR